MRTLILGLDAEGRSRVVDEQDVRPAPVDVAPGLAAARLYSTSESPPGAPPAGMGTFADVGLAPGVLSWTLVEHEPYTTDDVLTVATEMHYNNALELVYVLEGSARLLVDDGAYEVRAGDCYAVPGVDHALHAGPNGTRLLVVIVGTTRPDRS